jgi:hypothetical protein
MSPGFKVLAVWLLLAGLAAPDNAPAQGASTDGVPVRGVVTRPPVVTEAAPPARYRTRRAPADEPAVPAADCGCDPGRFAVVWLTGDHLPPIRPASPPPSMTQKDTRFEPSVIAVGVGGTVAFPNLDPFFHNVFSYSATRRFDLGRYPAGESESVTFEVPGIVPVFCEIHYSMRAYVHVLETPYFAVSDDQRQFEIPRVQPGTYVLHVWQENQPDLARTIEIGDEPVDLRIP